MKDGFLLINKEVDWTSRDVCNKISHQLNNKKVGHTGTLDPFATGLLVVAIGKASKFIPYLETLDKSYIAELTLGSKTNTGDLTGEIIETKQIPELNKEIIQEVLNSFLGDIDQIPPMTSAISINGQKLYKLAHKGIEIDRKPRKIHVYEIKLISYFENRIIFSCKVSKGTYIRTLGEDIAEKLQTVGYLTGLKRTNVGNFSVNDAIKVSDVDENKIISIVSIASKIMKTVYVNITYIEKVKNGVKIPKAQLNNSGEKLILLVDEVTNNLLAIYELKNENYICKRGLWS